MRGLTSIGAAILLLGLAGWLYSQSGLGLGSGLLCLASLVMFYRGVQGQGVTTAAGDAMNTVDFIRDPGGAIVDSAVDTIGQMIGDRTKEKEGPAFDADAALARYMAKREPMPFDETLPAARPQFGRKGLSAGS